MKNLKFTRWAFAALFIFSACQEDTSNPILESNINAVDKVFSSKGHISYQQLLENGFDLEQFRNSFNSNSKSNILINSKLTTQSYFDNFINEENFDAAKTMNLVFEDFEPSTGNDQQYFSSPLNSETPKGNYNKGDIVQGVSFSSSNDFQGIGLFNLIYGENNNRLAVYWSNTNPDNFKMVVDFENDNVRAVKMDVFKRIFGYDNRITADVIGFENIIASIQMPVSLDFNTGTFWGIQSEQPIKQIVLKVEVNQGEYGWVDIDNLYFGDIDSDNDGYFDTDDNHPNSNLSETILIGSCNTDVANLMVANGTMMADEVDDKIALIWDRIENSRSRWYRPQSDFYTEMYRLTGEWQYKKLITWKQRSAIMTCVRNSNFFSNPS